MMKDTEIKEVVKKFWDCSSTTYDSSPGHSMGSKGEKDAWKQELSRNLPSSPQTILDVGCGTGAIGVLFAEMGHHVTGLDLSEAMMAKARQKAKECKLTIDMRTGDAEHLPFGDGTFDVVVNRHLLWTLPHPEIALKEWNRVLKTDGMLLIVDGVWDDKRLATRMRRGIGDGLTRLFERDDAHHRSYDKNLRSLLPHDGGMPRKTVLAYLERAGFSQMNFRDLMYIREMQKQQLAWYRKIAPTKSYYILVATKQN